MKTVVSKMTVDEMFFTQLEEFCRMVQQEFLARFDEISAISTSTAPALAFTETLMLCPTQEAARLWISRELPAALSFVLAVQGMQRQLRQGTLKLPAEAPQYQTRFYLLATTVREHLESLHAQPA